MAKVTEFHLSQQKVTGRPADSLARNPCPFHINQVVVFVFVDHLLRSIKKDRTCPVLERPLFVVFAPFVSNGSIIGGDNYQFHGEYQERKRGARGGQVDFEGKSSNV